MKNFLRRLANALMDHPNTRPENNLVEPPKEKVEPEKPVEPQPILEADGIKVGDKFVFLRYPHLEFPLANWEPYVEPGKSFPTAGMVFTVEKIEEVKDIDPCYWSYKNKWLFKCNDNFQFDIVNSIKNKVLCKLEDVAEHQKIIDGENDFQVEFKVRKKEGLEDFSVWWRSTNHPEYREWRCIVNPNTDNNCSDSVNIHHRRDKSYSYYGGTCSRQYYHPYYFDTKADAEEAIGFLKTRDPKRLMTFERQWIDV